MRNDVKEYIAALRNNLIIDDTEALEILIAVAVAHKIPIANRNMLWLRLQGASGIGKTEILRSLIELDGYCAKGEYFTPAAFRRGYVPKDKAEKTPLLEQWNGKLVITKEFNAMLTSNSKDRLSVFGLLRSVHDGELVSDYNSDAGHIEQRSRFDWIAGVTSYADSEMQLEGQLGSRFITLRWGRPSDYRAMVRKAISNDEKLPEIRQANLDKMKAIIDNTPDDNPNPEIDYDWLSDASNIVAIGRTYVKRDGFRHNVVSLPEVEAPTRVSQGFAHIIKGLHLIGIDNYKPYILRLMFDNISLLRAEYIKAVLDGGKSETEIASRLKVSQPTVSYTRQDLHLLGIKLDTVKSVIENCKNSCLKDDKNVVLFVPK